MQGLGFRVQGSGFRVQGRGGGFAAKKEANPALLRSAAPSKGRGSHGHALLPMEGGAPKGRRLGEEMVYVRKSKEQPQQDVISTSPHAC